MRKLLLLALQLAARNVRLQAPPEVGRAHASVDDGEDDEDDGDDGEGGERAEDGVVVEAAAGLVHAHEFEEEVGEAGEVEELFERN